MPFFGRKKANALNGGQNAKLEYIRQLAAKKALREKL